MKKSNVIIAVTLTAALAGGAVYGAYHYTGASNKSVEVVSVSSVDMGNDMYGWGYEDTKSGTIISKSSQSVSLNEDAPLKKVYVHLGDSVKRGDPLLEYDMTMTELQREMQDLQKQMLEINLKSQQKDLEKILGGKLPSYDDTSDGDAEVSLADDVGDVKTMADGPETGAESTGDGQSNAETAANVQILDSSDSGETIPDNGAGTDELLIDSNDFEENPGAGNETDNQSLIIDDHMTQVIEGEPGIGEAYTEQSTEKETQTLSEDAAIIDAMGSFISRAKVMLTESRSQISADETLKALKDWSLLSKGVEVWGTGADGAEKTLTGFVLNDKVKQMFANGVISQDMVDTLYQAYAITARSNYLYWLNTIVPEGKSLSDLTSAELKAAGTNLEELKNAYERCSAFAKQLESASTTAADSEAYLGIGTEVDPNTQASGAINTLKFMQDVLPAAGDGSILGSHGDGDLYAMLQQIENAYNNALTETEAATEADPGFGGGDFDYGYDDFGSDTGSGLTAEELEQARFDAEQQIKETELQIREADLELQKYDRTLKDKIIKASMDGVVTTLGSEGTGMGDSYIVISGAKGLYMRGLLNEFSLGTVEIGDYVSGSNYSGGTFVAEIVEISQYPTDGSNTYFYYGGGQENTNASYYPFLAYIEDTEGLEEGEVNYQFDNMQQGGVTSEGIYLQPYFVKLDSAGRAYVYTRGTDGLLHKQYVRTGSESSSYSTQIIGGLSGDDLIAFPYGQNVKDGAKTTQVDELSSVAETYDY